MDLTGSTDSPGLGTNTPSPSTDVLLAIRTSIQPRTGWWQFELRPWHYALSIAAVFGCTLAVVVVVLTHATVR